MSDRPGALERPVGSLRASADGHSLVEADGTPFFWLGDTAWELMHRLDREDALRYLDDRAARGFTVIQAVAHGRIMAGWSTGANRYGDAPYLDGDPLRPNEAFFAHVDWVIERALERGIRTALLPVWSWTVVVDEGALHTGNAEPYGRWIGERYRDHGLVWVLGGDIAPIAYPARGDDRLEPVDYRPVYDALATGILAGAGQDAFLTYHQNASAPVGAPPARSSLYFGDRAWHRLSMLQSSHFDFDADVVDAGGGAVRTWTDDDGTERLSYCWSGPYNHLPVAAEYAAEPPRPVLDGEPCYEAHPRFLTPPRVAGTWIAEDVRAAAYHALFAGAAGHTYGHVSLWDFYGAGGEREECWFFPEGFPRPVWTESLDAPGADQMRHARRLLESRPWYTAAPDASVVVGDAGVGPDHVGALRDRDGRFALVYLPRGGDVTVDLGRLAGPGPTWWVDPRTGSADRIPDHGGSGNEVFRAPSAGRGEDWVLVLDDATRGFGAPGATGIGANS